MRARRLVPAAAVAVALLGACGGSPSSQGDSTSTVPITFVPGGSLPLGASSETPTSTVEKPAVQLPAQTPTTLVSTTITPGSGPQATNGDILVVNYVGVRSVDGTMFDNSYDRGEPLVVSPLGGGTVIPGWDQGLVGAQTGERLQLDVPNDLAYGQQDKGIIKAGDALSFVIDVVKVIQPGTAAQAPTVSVAPAAPRSQLEVQDLVVGRGAELVEGNHVVLQIVGFRGDTGAEVINSWKQSQPLVFTYGKDQVLKGIVDGIKGMKEGGRRQIGIPFDQAFGASGSSQLGVPPSTDLVLVVDLVAVY